MPNETLRKARKVDFDSTINIKYFKDEDPPNSIAQEEEYQIDTNYN